MVTARRPESQVAVLPEATRTRTARPGRNADTPSERVITSPFGITIVLYTSDVSAGGVDGELRHEVRGAFPEGSTATTRHTVES